MFLLKIAAGLIGLVLTLGGLGAFFWSIWLFLSYLTYNPSTLHLAGTPKEIQPDISASIGWFIGATFAIYLGTQLGRFARGDFD